MIAIWIDNDPLKALDMPPDASFVFEANNPLFGSINDLARSFTYAFKLFRTPKNDVLLNFPASLRLGARAAMPAALYYNGTRIPSAELIIRGANEKTIEINIAASRRADWLFDKNIQSLPLGVQFQQLSAAQEIGLALGRNTAIPMPALIGAAVEVSGRLYESGFLPSGGATPLTDVLDVLAALINADTTNNNATALVVAGLDPDVRSYLVVTRANPAREFWAKPLINFYDLRNAENKYALWFNFSAYSTENFEFLDEQIELYIDGIMADPTAYDHIYPELILIPKPDELYLHGLNRHEGGSYFIGDNVSVVSPQLRLTPAIRRVLDTYGFALDAPLMDGDAFQDLLLINNHSNITEGSVSNRTYHEILFWYADKYPLMTFAEFLDQLRSLYALYIDFNWGTYTLTIRTAGEILATRDSAQVIEPVHTSPAHALDDYPDAREGYTFALAEPQPAEPYRNNFDTFNKSRFAPFALPPGRNKIESKLSMPVRVYRNNDDDELTLTNQESTLNGLFSNMPAADTLADAYEGNPFDDSGYIFRQAPPFFGLSYYQGFVDGKPITSTVRNEHVIGWGDVTESTDGTPVVRRGFYSTYWKEFVSVLQNAVLVKKRAYLNEVQLANLDMTRLLRIDNQTYLIKRFRTTYSARGIAATEFELLTVF